MKLDPEESGYGYISIFDFDLPPVTQPMDVVIPDYPLISKYYFEKNERFDVFRSLAYLQVNGEHKGILLDRSNNMYIEVVSLSIRFTPERYILIGNLSQLNAENIKGVVKDCNDKGWYVNFYDIKEHWLWSMGIN